MNLALIVLAKVIPWVVLIGLVGLFYFMIVRPFLRRRPELAAVFETLEAHEAGLLSLAWYYFEGFRTIFWARFLAFAGVALPLLDLVQMLPLADLLPPKFALYVGPMLYVIGFVTEWLRKQTTSPVATLPTPVDAPAPGAVEVIAPPPVKDSSLGDPVPLPPAPPAAPAAPGAV